MAEPIIQVENLSKKYIIHHLANEHSTALRDVLTRKAAAVARKIRHPSRNQFSSTSREEFWALNNISFEVERGDAIGIIGRNGAGKSTLLKILSRITEPTTGRVRLRGRVASLLEVGTGFHPELTGRENIYLNGAILGMSKSEIRKKFGEIVSFADIQRFLDTPVKRYSSGMYVRLAFAVAAHLEPDILLIDEVLAVGDAQFQKKCLGKMEDVSKRGRTVFFVSHNMNMISRMCSRAILLDDGQMISHGPVTDIVQMYTNGYEVSKDTLREFQNDSEKNQQISAISIRRLNGEILEGLLQIDEAFRIMVTYNLKKELPGAYGNAIIRNKAGDIVMMLDSRDHPQSASLDTRGVIEMAIDIPAPLLVPDQYTVTPAIARSPHGGVDIRTDAVAFEIVDTKGARIRRPGHICALFKWSRLN